MICKCKSCGGVLVYDPAEGALKCTQCGQTETDAGEKTSKDTQYMDVRVYRCSSCGANLMIYGNEQATFCAFCGHPTVIFDHVAKEAWPDTMIPFSITEEQAVAAICVIFGIWTMCELGLAFAKELENVVVWQTSDLPAAWLVMIGILICMICVGFFMKRLRKFLKYRNDKARFSSAATTGFVRERQGKTWIR